jgi:hypothetical protein
MVTVIFRWWPGRPICYADFFIVSGTMVPPTLVGLFLRLLLAAWLVGVAWAFSLTENGSYDVLPVSKLGRYFEEIDSGHWSPSPKLVNERLIGGVISQGTHYVGVSGIGEFIYFLGEPPDVILEAFPALLGAPLKVPKAPRALVVGLEVSNEGLTEVDLVMDGVGW